jgi:hypothetical protein
MLLLAAAVVAHGFLGPQDDEANPAPRVLYVLLWVGVVPASLLLGPVWRTIKPPACAATACSLRCAAVHPVPLPGSDTNRQPSGSVPSSGWNSSPPVATSPPSSRRFLLLYAAIHTVARGCGTARAGSTGATPSRVLEPRGRTGAGGVGRRVSGCGTRCAASRRYGPAPGLVAFVAVWWGSTVFDGLSGWPGWAGVRAVLPVPGVVVDTLVLVAWSWWWHCSTAGHGPARRGAGTDARPDRRRLHDRRTT